MLISSYKKNLIITTLKKLVEKITSEIENINYGGCAILSCYLAESLKELNIPFTFIMWSPSVWCYDDIEDCWYKASFYRYDDIEDCWYDESLYWRELNQEEFTYTLQNHWSNGEMLSCGHMMIKLYDYIVNYDTCYDYEFLYEADSTILDYVKESCLSDNEQLNFDLWNQTYDRNNNQQLKEIINNYFNDLQNKL